MLPNADFSYFFFKKCTKLETFKPKIRYNLNSIQNYIYIIDKNPKIDI